MEMIPALLSPAWQRWGWVGLLMLIALTARDLPWAWLRHDGRGSRFAATTVAVLVVWQVRAVMPDGPAVHLLGATLLTLAFGPVLAGVSLLAVLAAATLKAGTGFGAYGVNALLLACLPVALSYGLARASEWLPRHFFVYVFAAGFFGAALTAAVTALAACAVLGFSGSVPRDAVIENYLPTSVLLLFPEAFLTGALVTLAAVYRPDWLVSFRDEDYVDGR